MSQKVRKSIRTGASSVFDKQKGLMRGDEFVMAVIPLIKLNK